MTGATSGLNVAHRIKARDLSVEAALLGLRRAPSLHYTQDGRRWEGIDKGLKAWRGECPTHADCSAFVTWCIWCGLSHFHGHDVVNGAAWKAGYTGTMIGHGRQVAHPGALLRGDAILYGDPFGRTGHTAIVVGRRSDGMPMVVSFGSEPGPFYLPYNYRPVTQARRYI